jgi:GNAT superfamily N-acetyltransferase
MNRLELADLSSKDLDLLRRFYSGVFIQGFPDRDERESFQNILKTLKLTESGRYGGNDYRVLTLLESGKIIGGAIIDYFVRSRCGVIEFLLVDRESRGKGYSKIIMNRIEEILKESARERGEELAGMFGEAEIPFTATKEAVDPWKRLAILGRLGFARVCFRYVQPALQPGKKPVKHLMLLFKRGDFQEGMIENKILAPFLEDYFRWAIRIREPERQLASLGMKQSLDDSEGFLLESLPHYCRSEAKRNG